MIRKKIAKCIKYSTHKVIQHTNIQEIKTLTTKIALINEILFNLRIPKFNYYKREVIT